MTRQKVIDLLAMSRFANLPTVWSNGLLGVLIGWIAFPTTLCPGCLIAIGVALSSLYLGGCFFNDWHDLAFDEKTRPDRPIPSGRWKRGTILNFAVLLMLLGVGLSFAITLASGYFATGIVICILAYTKWHKVHPISFVFMAGARALIYPLAALSVLPWDRFLAQLPVFVILALGLGGYILGISLTARAETSKTPISDARKTFPILCLCFPIVFISGPLLADKNGMALIPLALFLTVIALTVRQLRSNHKVGQFVSRTLAAIPLVDFLLVFVVAPNIVFWVVCPLLALAALGLQRIAPAT
ncbi:UbiA family prenyltransferase [Verrucomicrobiaceae bacterium 227]